MVFVLEEELLQFANYLICIYVAFFTAGVIGSAWIVGKLSLVVGLGDEQHVLVVNKVLGKF